MKVYPYTQVFNIAEPADNPTTILEVTCLRPYTGPDKLFEVFLYGCYIPLSPLQKQEIFFALDRLYSAHEDELSREREKQNREKLQAAIQKAQNLLNS